MNWIIYRSKDKLESPRAIPFEDLEIANEWVEQQKNRVEIIDVTKSCLESEE